MIGPIHLKRLALCGIAFAVWVVFDTTPAFATKLKIVDVHYAQHFKVGQTITFTARLRNDEPLLTSQNGYVDFVMTDQNGVETSNASTAVLISDDGVTLATVTATTSAKKGIFSVTAILFHATAVDTENDRKSMPVPIHVGNNAQEISVAPGVFNFGTIPLGRNMHPMPLKVSWDFFLFNRLGLDQPFFVRIYTDNSTRYQGVPGAIHIGSPAGLVSSDGKYSVPVRAWCLNFGPATGETGWAAALSGPPPVEDNTAWRGPILNNGKHNIQNAAWQRIPDYSEMTANNDTWRILIGQDPYDTEYVHDGNQIGDFTLPSPFDVYLATQTGVTSVKGKYYSRMIFEIYTP